MIKYWARLLFCVFALVTSLQGMSQERIRVKVNGLKEGVVNAYEEESLSLSYECPSTAPGLSVVIRLFVNGKEIHQPEDKGFGTGYSNFKVIGLPKSQSSVTLKLDFVDSSGIVVDKKEYSLLYKDVRKNLHFLGIGVGGKMRNSAEFKTLSWPSTDVETIQGSILRVASESYFIKSQKILIKEEETTRSAIINELKSLSEEPLGESDVVMLYLSGHGLFDNRDWFFISRDAKLSNLVTTAVSGAEIRDYISRITRKGATVFSFVDACQAEGLYGNRPLPLKSALFAASKVEEVSSESLGWKNSAFAAAFGNALGGKAYLGSDGVLTVGALQGYLYSQVMDKTKGNQHPVLLRAGIDEQSPLFKISQQETGTEMYKTVRGVGPMLMSLAPGVGQIYKKEYLKGGLLMGGTVAGVTGIVLCESQRQAFAAQMTQTHDINVIRQLQAKEQNMLIARNVFIGLTSVAYVYNLVDAAVAPGKRQVKLTGTGIAYSF